MARYRLMSDPATGNVAVYRVLDANSADDGPLNDPYGHLDRVQIHSGMIYPSAWYWNEVAVTIPAQAADTKYSGQIDLFEHGNSEPCMVEGRILDLNGAGNHVAFNGTVPVDVHATGHATWLALGSTDTHVVLVYFGITAASRAALNLTVEAAAYDFLASGPAPTGHPSLPLLENNGEQFTTIFGQPVRIAPYFAMGRGKIDSRRRYLRKVDAGADFALATGPTLSIIGKGITTSASYVQNEVGWRWRYSCAGYTKQTTIAWNGTATDGGAYEAPHILVKR